MKFGYTIVYVSNVASTLAFYEKAFGFSRRFLHEAGDYGELETGDTTLAFASHGLGSSNFPAGYVAVNSKSEPLGIELVFVTQSVQESHKTAISVGAVQVSPPTTKPWGQVVSYVRCPEGTLIELCTPMGG